LYYFSWKCTGKGIAKEFGILTQTKKHIPAFFAFLLMEALASAAHLVSPSLVFPVVSATPAAAKRPYNRRPKVNVDQRPKRKYQRRVQGPPGFLIKLRAMLNDASLLDIVRWNQEGNGVVVLDVRTALCFSF
jgi:hypothetical protein